jgi:hypothetical protein
MMRHNLSGSENMAAAIDRLVSGDLDETARRSVLAWLDEQPARWRQCGLTFLEAQTWSQALGAGISPPPARPARGFAPVPHTPERRHWTGAPAAIIAAGIALAFGLGIMGGGAFRHGSDRVPGRPQLTSGVRDAVPREEHDPRPPRETPVLASVGVKPSGWGLPDSVQIPVVPNNVAASAPKVKPQIPEHIRRQWERRGYHIESQRRYLFARLPDGEQVAVPIEHISLNPVGTKIY